MICFNCGVKLHNEELQECYLCGVKFPHKCPSCNSLNPVMAKYCLFCGTRIAKNETESSVQNFTMLAENRKNVAVIFADVSGFTALSEKNDPEEVREIINDCFNYITKPVYELEGTIDKYIGDCVMILFGARYVHSDDAKRAVVCAMKMMEMIKEFTQQRLHSKGFSVDLSIGVNFGLVVTGSVGNYFDKDYTVMGDIVNTAQRLQSIAGKGMILVSESVFMETKDAVHYSRVQEVMVKNKENPVKCYSPITQRVEYTLDADMPFVERDSHLKELNILYNKIVNRTSHCVMVTGEAGIGKTRLLKEFALRLGNDTKKVWVDCGSNGKNRVYFLLSNILMNIMNINPEDTGSVKQNRLMSFLDYILSSRTEEEKRRNSNFLGLVLGLSRDNEFQSILNSMSFDSVKREILKQLTLFFSHYCDKYKAVFFIDGMHWADESSIYMLKELVITLSEYNILFLLSSRSEVEEFTALGVRRYSHFKLEALKDESVSCLVGSLLNCSSVDEHFLNAVIKFTKGNPLYLREFVYNVKKTGKHFVKTGKAYIDIHDLGTIPNNIQGTILANLSELEDSAKMFLQAASVIGKDFSLTLVSELFGSVLEDTDILKKPIQFNIISLKSVYTALGSVEKVFTFNHDIEREAIYDSILNKNKKQYHKKIAEIIEMKHSKDLENYYEILAEHYHKGSLEEKASHYYLKTAVKYKNDFNFTSSLEYFDKYLEVSNQRSDLGNQGRVVEVLTHIASIYLMTANYERAHIDLEKALSMANSMEDIYTLKILKADIYKSQGLFDEALGVLEEIQGRIKQGSELYGKLLQMKCTILRIMGNPEALSLAKKSERILLKSKDYQSLSETMNQAGIIYYFTRGDIDHSLFYLNKSLRYAEKTNSLAILGKVTGNLGAIYHATGRTSRALEFLNRSMEISGKISDQQGYITSGINLGILYMDKGLFEKAGPLFRESLKATQEISSKLYECITLTNLGDLLYETSNNQEAMKYYNQSVEMAKTINVPVEEGVNYIGIAKILVKKQEYEKAEEILDCSAKIFEEAGEVMYLSDYYRYKCICEATQNHCEKALEYCEQALTVATESKNDMRKLKALRLKAMMLVNTGDSGKALSLYAEGIQLAEQIESDYEAAKGYYRRYEALSKAGREEEARVDLQKAKEAIRRVDLCRWTEKIQLTVDS